MEITITIQGVDVELDAEGYKGIGCLQDVESLLLGIDGVQETTMKDESIEVVNAARVRR